MKIAKTNEEEMSALMKALQECEWLADELKHSYFGDIDFSEFEVFSRFDKSNAESFLDDLVSHLSNLHFQRIIWNCRTMLDNCADPDSDTLDFHPDIKAGLKLLDQQKESALSV